jgi:hypothetical protein
MPSDIKDLILRVNQHIVNPLIALLFAVAWLVFFWGLAQYILNADNEQSRRTGAQHMLWGVIGMFVMFSVWALMWVIVNTFGIDATPIRDFQP